LSGGVIDGEDEVAGYNGTRMVGVMSSGCDSIRVAYGYLYTLGKPYISGTNVKSNGDSLRGFGRSLY
jgi:hypothetical protein